ncbi:MAG TPA: choice-of-anchor D domain-containing protein [Terriglobales bacterium]|nr:choice-of-anchor D domain-containing protein [Terriglobales bacterium]
MSGTGVVVQGTIQLWPSTLAFGNQQIGTTSTAKTVTLANTSSQFAMTISSIAVGSNAFKQTNNCPITPATLAANGNCTIQVPLRLPLQPTRPPV